MSGGAEEIPPGPFAHLLPAHNVAFIAQAGTHENGGAVLAKREEAGSRPVPLTAENVGSFFEPADTADKALEFCQLLHWGTLVEDVATFDRILRLLPPMSGKEPDLGTLAKAVPGGFEVSFTAFVMEHGMGAGSHLRRFRYLVGTKDKRSLVRCLDVVTYCEGPALNWQTGEPGTPEQETREYQRILARDAFLDRVFALCPKRIPAGFNQGLPASGPPPPPEGSPPASAP